MLCCVHTYDMLEGHRQVLVHWISKTCIETMQQLRMSRQDMEPPNLVRVLTDIFFSEPARCEARMLRMWHS